MKIEFNNEKLERFIPIDFRELQENLEKENIIKKDAMQNLVSTLNDSIHNSLHPKLLNLQKNYHPFNPDKDTVSIKEYSKDELVSSQKQLQEEIRVILNNANYEKLSQEELNSSINEKSPYGVEVSVDFEYFENIELYFRGSAIKTEKFRSLKSLYFKKEETQTKVFKRLFILFKPKDSSQKIFIKLFKNIPSTDLDTLFPNTKVKMTLVDKLKLLLTGGSGTVGGAVTLMSKIAILIEPIALLTAIGAFVGILWRQVKSVFNHRVKYMAKLSKNLYFYNLGNNAGVISHLIQSAQEEEFKESFLAYIFLYKNGALSAQELDKSIEEYIKKTYNISMDFEIEDALLKLRHMELITYEDGKYRVA